MSVIQLHEFFGHTFCEVQLKWENNYGLPSYIAESGYK